VCVYISSYSGHVHVQLAVPVQRDPCHLAWAASSVPRRAASNYKHTSTHAHSECKYGMVTGATGGIRRRGEREGIGVRTGVEGGS
jgi:hypothetical protein